MRLVRSLALTTLTLAFAPFAAVAQNICAASAFGDSVCDCGCGQVDPDCRAGTFTVCEVGHCPAGQVPWEHNPEVCMTSACGDGWKDPARGEVCDDGNAVASGGCAARCTAVNPGYTCGEMAAGCRRAPVDAGTVEPDAAAVAPADAASVPVIADAAAPAGDDAAARPADDAASTSVDAGAVASADSGSNPTSADGASSCAAVDGGSGPILLVGAMFLALRRGRAFIRS